MQWYVKVLKSYAVFSGRAHRREYWMFTLFNLMFSIAATALERILGVVGISAVYSLAVLVPTLAVGVRRLHDTNRAGWWLLLFLVPILGAIVLIVFLATKGDKVENTYGPPPADGVAPAGATPA